MDYQQHTEHILCIQHVSKNISLIEDFNRVKLPIRYVRQALLSYQTIFLQNLLFGKISVKKPASAYITDGVSKQDTESLLELQKTCHLYPLIVELGVEVINITEITNQLETEDR